METTKTINETTVYMYARVNFDTIDGLLERIVQMRQSDTRIIKILSVDLHIVYGEKLGYANEPMTIEFYEAAIRVEYDENRFFHAQNSPASREELDLWAKNSSN
jgi:hypothetical protein